MVARPVSTECSPDACSVLGPSVSGGHVSQMMHRSRMKDGETDRRWRCSQERAETVMHKDG
eukprot:224305-Rhodomonas_salina.3